MENGAWWIYGLYSESSDIIYVGMSEQKDIRLKEHNAGKVKSTKAHVPWIKFFEEFIGSIEEARKQEKYYKNASGKRKLRTILNEKFPKQ